MLNVALKEWDATISALAAGRQIMLLRKGGIHEDEGRFEIEHRRFVFYPTFVHQHLDWLKPDAQENYERSLAARGLASATIDPPLVTFTTVGTITDILRVPSRGALDALASEHVWLPPLIDMRVNYKPHNPLYVLLVRAAVLAEPIVVDHTAEYAGCKSWVPLTSPIDAASAAVALDDDAYTARCNVIRAALS